MEACMNARTRAAEAIFPGVILTGVAALVAGGIVLAGYSWNVIAFPFGAAVLICGLCLFLLATLLLGRNTQPVDETPLPPSDVPTEPLTLASLAWVFVLALFLYGLGFVFGPAAYLLIYLRVHGSSWLLSIAVAAASLLVTWGLFIKVLRVLLPMQPLWLA
jgi:Tripartite tricarboxylate transporter TctB family